MNPFFNPLKACFSAFQSIIIAVSSRNLRLIMINVLCPIKIADLDQYSSSFSCNPISNSLFEIDICCLIKINDQDCFKKRSPTYIELPLLSIRQTRKLNPK